MERIRGNTVLIAGCGGGYDVFCGLDLFFRLTAADKTVVLANYTFTATSIVMEHSEEILKECCYKVSPGVEHTSIYFPEADLANQVKTPVYCFLDTGIKSLTEAYNKIIELEAVDTVVLADGGTDSLMCGDEKDSEGEPALGTPYEDVSSIVAVQHCCAEDKYLLVLGNNIDSYHGVLDEHVWRNIANLTQQGYFVGCDTLTVNDESTRQYIDVFNACKPENSIVNSFVVAAIKGHYGNYHPPHLRERLGGVKNCITPLMAQVWVFELEGVYRNLIYDVGTLKNTDDSFVILQCLKIEI